MAVVDVQNMAGDKVSQIDLSDSIFNIEVKSEVLHEVVKMQLACRRAGTASVKRRSDVKGSTRKLYRQKGTGRARRGDIKSPVMRGGGVVFGPKPKSYAYSVPKKVRRLALKMALSSKFQDKELIVLNSMDFDTPKTKKFLDVMNALKLENVLIVTSGENENLELSSRNVASVKVMRTEGLNVYDVLKYQSLLLLEPSVSGIEGRLSE
ncbi:50S ribosomal protein L4 [Desulforegula conservatrix]|uniref:50S ribosomal protein L4 n=1 Tax=Desulforegula conservatrix TaxID=153026 RepID=UPI0004045753|nr:50S ribosomal protein L4 [Desulforegula conservatrix]